MPPLARRRFAACAAALIAASALGACGGGSSSKQVVARVGDETVTGATLTHWMYVLHGGVAVSDPTAAQNRQLRRHTLQYLIDSRWLVGEAASRGIAISAAEVRQQIGRAENATYPGGAAELREFLKSTGQSLTDVEWQARAELAATKLRQMALDSASKVTQAQVAAYYAAHKRSFLVSERRVARFSNWKHKAPAEKFKREVEAGRSLTLRDRLKVGEVFTSASVPPGDAYEVAIDKAKPYVVSGPYKVYADYWLYQVVKIIPPRQQTLAEVSSSIRQTLTSERRRNALANFIETWTAAWTARTDCSSGNVVEKCKQYDGPKVPERSLELQ